MEATIPAADPDRVIVDKNGYACRCTEEVHRLSMSQEAYAAFEAFHDEIETRLMPATGDLSNMYGWGSKLCGAVARISGILTLVSDMDATKVTHEAMQDAIQWGYFLIESIKHVLSRCYAAPEKRMAVRVIRWLKAERKMVVTQRDIHDKFRCAEMRKSADFTPVIDVLKEHGYIRECSMPSQKAGRPSHRFEVNPTFLEE